MANTKMVLYSLSLYQLCSQQLAWRGWRELRNVFVSTQGKADPGSKKSFWVIHSGCSHREILECRGHVVSVAMAAPAGSLASLTASAGWAVPLGKLITQPHLPLLCGHGFFPFSLLDLLLMRTPSDAITHFLNYKNVIAILFPLVPLFLSSPFFHNFI